MKKNEERGGNLGCQLAYGTVNAMNQETLDKTSLPMVTDHALNYLDDGIRNIVLVLRSEGIETIESCEGGDGHAFPDPTVRFCGGQPEGYRALSVALQHGLRVMELRRVWPIQDGEPTGPYWELTFVL